MSASTDTKVSENTSQHFGEAIRQRRKQAGLTLIELAAATDLSQPFLSQIENDRAQPSLTSLHRIADALGTTPQALIGGGDRFRPTVVRRAEAPRVEVADGVWSSIVLGGEQPLRIVEFAGLPGEFLDYHSHPGHEVTYVVDGTVEIDLDGQIHVLSAGDAVSYDSAIPHRHRADGDVTMLLLETESTGAPGHI